MNVMAALSAKSTRCSARRGGAARILARRGFMTEPERQPDGFYTAGITEAGREAAERFRP